MPMGCDITRWTPPGAETLDELSPILELAGPGQAARHGDHEPGAAERLPRHARDLQRRLPERGPGEADREHRLLPRHDRRPDRRPADRPGDAAAVARDVDGPALDRRPVRQRLRLRLSEQSLVVVADDAAAVRGPSADRLRAPLRRGGQRRRPPRRAEEAGQPARLGHRGDRPPEEPARPGRSRPGRPVPGDRARGRAPHPEGRGRREGQPPARPRPARRRAGLLRRPRPADVRPPGAGAAGGRHPRHHLPARPRDQQPDLPRDRRPRPAPPADAPRQRPRQDRPDGEDQRSSTSRSSPSSSPS